MQNYVIVSVAFPSLVWAHFNQDKILLFLKIGMCRYTNENLNLCFSSSVAFCSHLWRSI